MASVEPSGDPSLARTVLDRRRQAIHERLLAGASGAEIASALTAMVDDLIVDRFRDACRDGGEGLGATASRHC